jgi:hypothetical protein
MIIVPIEILHVISKIMINIDPSKSNESNEALSITHKSREIPLKFFLLL